MVFYCVEKIIVYTEMCKGCTLTTVNHVPLLNTCSGVGTNTICITTLYRQRTSFTHC